ncbi:MAG: DUF1592 domain-containing protein [Pirellulaceae bacterium]
MFFRNIKTLVTLCTIVASLLLSGGELRGDDNWATEGVALFKKFCIDCHNNDLQEAEVNFEPYADASRFAEAESMWKEAIKRIEFGAMPPDDAEQPSDDERKAMVRLIEGALYGASCDLDAKPGKVTMRRLNRHEYNNTIRDLFGLTLRPADAFPADEVGAGFDNNGDVLSLPPMLLEKYVEAAELVAAAAITDPSELKQAEARWQAETVKIDGEFETNNFEIHTVSGDGVMSGNFTLPYTAKYGLKVDAAVAKKDDKEVELEAFIDGESVGVMKFGFRDDEGGVDHESINCDLEKGEHSITIRGVGDDPKKLKKYRVRGFRIEGPYGIPSSEVADCHWRLLRHRPQKGKRSVLQAAKENLAEFLPKAFRSPVDDQTIEAYARLVEVADQREETFERGMQIAVTAALVSPRFLFRSELPKGDDKGGDAVELDSFQLANRLSYFLWSSMPDDRLFDLARQGKLKDSNPLMEQVKRMLGDSRSDALIDNFADQWLGLRNLQSLTPDPEQFPNFDEALRTSMLKETQLMFIDCVRNNRGMLSLLNAQETFLNERLAKHYGVEGVKGDEFRKVSLKGTGRTGILTHASILMLTSNPTRTSPVKRGKWVMENILGSPPPYPPAGVPELEETASSNPDAPLREQLAIHRDNAMCASCHRAMDQIGFSFEHFDVVGAYRQRDGKHPIDASGELPSGEKFNDAEQLIQILRESRGEMFVSEFTRRLMTFALGRELSRQDECVVDEIVHETRGDGWRFADIATKIVLSRPFRFQTKENEQ